MRMALGDGLRQGTFFLGLLSVWLSASGHHSFAVDFDSDKLVTIAGVVSRMVPVTPHPRLYVDVTNGSGTRTTWELQGRRGDTEIVVGANVAVEGYLPRRRSEALYVTSIKVGAGPELSAGLELGEFRVGITPVSDYRTFAQIASEFSNDYPVDITGNWNNRYKGSLTVDDLEPKPTPFTADGRRRYAENQEFGKDPALRCINIGLPRLFGGPSRVKIYDVGPYYLFLYVFGSECLSDDLHGRTRCTGKSAVDFCWFLEGTLGGAVTHHRDSSSQAYVVGYQRPADVRCRDAYC